MCYMAGTRTTRPVRPVPPAPAAQRVRLDRVGVRELRQNLSVYLERVIAGERLEVTDRGHAVALLIPLPPAATLVERLVAEGRAIPVTRDRAPVASPPLRLTAAQRRRLWAAFEETREDRL